MSKISTSSTGTRYLDNLVSLNILNDGICNSGFGRVFDGTQSITFSTPTNAAYYMTYFDFSLLTYVQVQYSSQTFSSTGSFSNFAIWNRELLNNEMAFLNNNIEFILNNQYNLPDLNGVTSIKGGNCLSWVPMLPTEGASVYDYINKQSYTIANYSAGTLISDSIYGPQLIDYSDTMNIDRYNIYIRDNIIETNWIPSATVSWTLEEIIDGMHITYTYDSTNNQFSTYVNGEFDNTSTYTFLNQKINIDSTSFSGEYTNITTRWYYVLYNRILDSTEIKGNYLYFLMPDYALTLDRESTILTAGGTPLVYTPLTY